ncbi:MAG: uroporphyrinogen-III synthase [Bryobacteraceae bacterium]|jgi:uroporphyrinogen-III synthase
MAFGRLKVLSLESRRAKEMETLIRREGGDPFVAPSVQERALDDHRGAMEFVDRLAAGEFDLVVCMTGAGLAFLRDLAAADSVLDRLAEGLRNTFIVSRGPKPVPILRELGARAQIVVPEPNTWKEVVEAVASRPERRIAVQEYGRPNIEMTAALEGLGAKVTPFAIYRWDLPADLEPLREAARRLAAREVDVVLFTSSIQLDHLFQIAGEMGIETEVRNSLANHAALASVGPIMTAALEEAGLPVDIVPTHPKMAGLVKAAAEQASGALRQKRGCGRT